MTHKPVILSLVLAACAVAVLPRTTHAQWYASADFVAPARFGSSDTVFQRQEDELIVDNEPTDEYVVGPESLLSTDNLKLGFTAAGRLTVGYREGEYGVEGSYLRTNQWDIAASVFDPDYRMASPFSLVGEDVNPLIDDNYMVSVAYQTELESAELHATRTVFPDYPDAAVWFLFGVRAMSISESLDYRQANAISTYDVSVDTDNRIIGPQVGIHSVSPLPFGYVTLTLKGAMAFNSIDKHVEFNGQPFDDDDGAACLIGETGIAYMVTPTPHLAVRLGYNLMGISDVALATADFEGVPTLINAGPVNIRRNGIGYHMPYIGMMLMY